MPIVKRLKQEKTIYLPARLTKDIDPYYLIPLVRESEKYSKRMWLDGEWAAPSYVHFYEELVEWCEDEEALEVLPQIRKLLEYLFDNKVAQIISQVPKELLEDWLDELEVERDLSVYKDHDVWLNS